MNHWPKYIDIWHGVSLGARRFNFVQMKSLGSCMAPHQGLKLLHSNI